eukprot:GHVP01043316.1.p1 GENE.GHVP01043316.1~~GHVP01043316.1.p1  ORF type:complete len:694 (+),score=125.00 GHVP01043316.1:1016-3097(+)
MKVSNQYQSRGTTHDFSQKVAPPQTKVDPGTRRGEVAELRRLLKNVQNDKDSNRKRDAMKRVVAHMTLGIDVSRLYQDVIMISGTSDPVVKKLVYFFLSTYTESHSDLAILAIGSLQKDCQDVDPTIRGLALRTMCSLRVPNLLEYLEPAVTTALGDSVGYVRRSAVMGALKIFNMTPEIFDGESCAIISRVEELLYDHDPGVLCSAIVALNEIFADQGGTVLTKNLIYSLLNRLPELDEWQLTLVLSLLGETTPETEDELYDFLNILDPLLYFSSPSVLTALIKCFLSYVAEYPKVRGAIAKRLCDPFLTMIHSSPVEIAHSLLLHLRLLLQNEVYELADTECPKAFTRTLEPLYRHFFILCNEPTFVKTTKIDILALLASPAIIASVQSEICEYISDPHSEVSTHAIEALGNLALRIHSALDPLVEQFLNLISSKYIGTSGPAIQVLRRIVKEQKDRVGYVSCVAVLSWLKEVKRFRGVHLEPATAAIWIVGECSALEGIPEAPYVLEHMVTLLSDYLLEIDSQETEQEKKKDEGSLNFDLSLRSFVHGLLTAILKMFCYRPGEISPGMEKLLALIASGVLVEVDLLDRSLYYIRMLRHFSLKNNFWEKMRSVVFDPLAIGSAIVSVDEEAANISKVLVEYNTLAVEFGTPSSTFVVVKSIPAGGRQVDTRHTEVAEIGGDTKRSLVEHLE